MEEWFFEYFKRIRREIDRMISEIERSLTQPLYDYEKKILTPLYEIRESEDKYIIYVDLPKVHKKENINITATEDKVIIEAKTEAAIDFTDLPAYGRQTFNKYYLELQLPVPIDAKKASANFKNGILQIKIPKKIKRFRIKID